MYHLITLFVMSNTTFLRGACMHRFILCGYEIQQSVVIDTMTVELKTRQVSSDFINNFQEKLVYVGDSNEYSEEFEQISKK